MSAHPAYLSVRDLRVEAEAERIAAADFAANRKLREVLLATAATVEGITFRTRCQSQWGTVREIAESIRDMAPSDDALMERDIEALALDRALDGVV